MQVQCFNGKSSRNILIHIASDVSDIQRFIRIPVANFWSKYVVEHIKEYFETQIVSTIVASNASMLDLENHRLIPLQIRCTSIDDVIYLYIDDWYFNTFASTRYTSNDASW